MQHSVTVVRKEQEHDLISAPVSRLFARMPSTMTALYYEARVLFFHLHVSAELFAIQTVGINESSSVENPREITVGLKMTNRTHTDERKMVQLYYLAHGCVISIFINRSMLVWSSG